MAIDSIGHGKPCPYSPDDTVEPIVHGVNDGVAHFLNRAISNLSRPHHMYSRYSGTLSEKGYITAI
eukprot:586003-Alexandrium_andersonii.AAC.1